jgi:signal transduction histidine kinase
MSAKTDGPPGPSHREQSNCGPSSELAALRAQVRSLQGQVRHLQRLSQVGTMAAMVAHEFNNILTPVMNYAQLAADGDEKMTAKAVRFALEGSRRATAISRSLLDLTGSGGEQLATVKLAGLVRQILEAMARDPAKDGIVLINKVPPELELTTRPAELAQVLLNLLINARWAVLAKGRGGRIGITARRAGQRVLIRVADSGVGIAGENLQRIFEPFFSTKAGQGSGLGLAVCKHIVESMKGTLSVRSQEGKGTIFSVNLPIAASGAEAKAFAVLPKLAAGSRASGAASRAAAG